MPCRPHSIFDHDRLSVAEQIACPSCRQPLPRSAPALQRQLNSYLDRVREALPTEEVCSESLEDYLARRRAWDERSTISRAAWTGHRHSGADDGSDGRQQRRPQDQQMSTLHIKVVNHTSYGTHPEVRGRLMVPVSVPLILVRHSPRGACDGRGRCCPSPSPDGARYDILRRCRPPAVRLLSTLPGSPSVRRCPGAWRARVLVNLAGCLASSCSPDHDAASCPRRVVACSQVYFRLLATTPFGRLTTAYCQRQNLERRHVCFKFNGVLIRDVQTPESLNMTDGDVLEAFWLPTLQANQRASRLSTLRSRRAE